MHPEACDKTGTGVLLHVDRRAQGASPGPVHQFGVRTLPDIWVKNRAIRVRSPLVSGHDEELSARVRQAVKIVATQLACSDAEALARMKTRIDQTRLTLDDLAPLIIDRLVRFDP